MRDGGRRFRRRRTRQGFPLAMAPAILVPVGQALAGHPSGYHTGLIKAFESGNMQTIATEIKNIVPYETIGYGYEGQWHPEIWFRNIGLIAGGYIAHAVANRLGANKQFKKIPIVGKYLQI